MNNPSMSRPWRRIALFVLPAVIFVGVIAVATLKQADNPVPGDAAPAFAAELLEGEGELALVDLEGQPVVLNFWASWCVPCEDEAPILNDAFDEFGDQVHFVGVDVKDARSEAQAFIAEHDVQYPSVRDEDGTIYADYGLTGQPETFFIDADGTIVEHVSGPLFADDLFALLQGMVSDGG